MKKLSKRKRNPFFPSIKLSLPKKWYRDKYDGYVYSSWYLGRCGDALKSYFVPVTVKKAPKNTAATEYVGFWVEGHLRCVTFLCDNIHVHKTSYVCDFHARVPGTWHPVHVITVCRKKCHRQKSK